MHAIWRKHYSHSQPGKKMLSAGLTDDLLDGARAWLRVVVTTQSAGVEVVAHLLAAVALHADSIIQRAATLAQRAAPVLKRHGYPPACRPRVHVLRIDVFVEQCPEHSYSHLFAVGK